MSVWKRVKIDFPTVKLGEYIEPVKKTVEDVGGQGCSTVYGVSNVHGICITGKESSKDISNYIVLEDNCFAFNPYRINVGSIGINDKRLKGCVSPAYVVFRTKNSLNPFLLFHYLKSDYGNHLINWYGNRGGVRNALRYDDLCEIDIPVLSADDQVKCLNNISVFDRIIEQIETEMFLQRSSLGLLRQTILQDAIEGKLTAEWRKNNPVRKGDPETDAVALLDKIKAEKQKLIAAGKLKKEKPLSPVTAEEMPFDLSDGWVWCRLGEIIYDAPRNGYSPKEVNYPTAVKSLKLGATTRGYFEPMQYKYIDELISENSFLWLLSDDILIQRSNSIDYVGVSAIYTGAPNEFIFPDLMMKIRMANPISTRYSHLFLSAPLSRSYFRNNASGSQKSMPKINQGIVMGTIFALPPLSEQRAIVGRVDKLLAMVDELERQVSERKTRAAELLQAVLREAFG